jgi:hypothetical protein
MSCVCVFVHVCVGSLLSHGCLHSLGISLHVAWVLAGLQAASISARKTHRLSILY